MSPIPFPSSLYQSPQASRFEEPLSPPELPPWVPRLRSNQPLSSRPSKSNHHTLAPHSIHPLLRTRESKLTKPKSPRQSEDVDPLDIGLIQPENGMFLMDEEALEEPNLNFQEVEKSYHVEEPVVYRNGIEQDSDRKCQEWLISLEHKEEEDVGFFDPIDLSPILHKIDPKPPLSIPRPNHVRQHSSNRNVVQSIMKPDEEDQFPGSLPSLYQSRNHSNTDINSIDELRPVSPPFFFDEQFPELRMEGKDNKWNGKDEFVSFKQSHPHRKSPPRSPSPYPDSRPLPSTSHRQPIHRLDQSSLINLIDPEFFSKNKIQMIHFFSPLDHHLHDLSQSLRAALRYVSPSTYSSSAPTFETQNRRTSRKKFRPPSIDFDRAKYPLVKVIYSEGSREFLFSPNGMNDYQILAKIVHNL